LVIIIKYIENFTQVILKITSHVYAWSLEKHHLK